METKLTAEPRSDAGKGVARKLRSAGRVPGVLYGPSTESTPLSVDAHDLLLVMHKGSNVLIDLDLAGEKHLTLAKDIVRDHVKGRYMHVDFMAINKDEKITVNVAVEPIGESYGVKEGGVIEHHLWEVEVQCLPFDVPEKIEIDVSDLGIGDGIHVSDLKAPSDVDILTNSEDLVLAVIQPQARDIEEEVEGEEGEEGELAEGAEGAESASEASASEEGGES